MNTYFPDTVDSIETASENVLDSLLKIDPTFDYPSSCESSFSHYLKSVESLIERVIPEDVKEFGRTIRSLEDFKEMREFYGMIEDCIPTMHWSMSESYSPYTISIVTLCGSNFTHGVGRFLSDVCSRWLIPGKQLELVYVHSMAFKFSFCKEKGYFIHELFAKVENKKDFETIRAHIATMEKEVKLNILAVQHARNVISVKSLTYEQKKMIIQENISSLLERPSKEFDHSIFDQMNHFLIKVSAEEKVTRIKEHLSPLVEFRPQIFERDIFNELQQFVFQLRDPFTASRPLKHLTKIVSYFYLFRKTTNHSILTHPHQRHVSIKLLRTKVRQGENLKRVLGIITTINLLGDNELFEEKHVLKAIESILPSFATVDGSTIIDKNTTNTIRTLYVEIASRNAEFFESAELCALREHLPRELKSRIESVINPIFMPRNEEEIMRNILALSNQLKYVQDIPQVIISFHKQTDSKISFTVILLRLLHPNNEPLSQLFHIVGKKVIFSDHEVKTVGMLQKTLPKEANVVEMHIEKKDFLRKDFSVDLYEARRFIYHSICEMVGEVRDYNGGMIAKQNEVLSELKKLLLQLNIRNDFILENFFYSLTPKYMQSILSPFILKKIFILLLETIEHDYQNQVFFMKTQIVEDFFLLSLGAVNPTIKEFLEEKVAAMDIDSSKLTISYVSIYEISCMSFLLRFHDPEEHERFLQVIIENVRIWKDTVQSTIDKEGEIVVGRD